MAGDERVDRPRGSPQSRDVAATGTLGATKMPGATGMLARSAPREDEGSVAVWPRGQEER